MTIVALIFFAWVVLQALAILAACALVKRKDPFKRDKARPLANTIKRIHP